MIVVTKKDLTLPVQVLALLRELATSKGTARREEGLYLNNCM